MFVAPYQIITPSFGHKTSNAPQTQKNIINFGKLIMLGLSFSRRVKKNILNIYNFFTCNLLWLFLENAHQKNHDQQSKKIAVLVHSFDGYKRFWKPAIFFTQRAFPLDIPIYYASEFLPICISSENNILTGRGNFVERLIKALNYLVKDYKYIFYLQEDIWIDSPISTSDLTHFIELMETENIDCLKLGKYSFAQEDRESILKATDSITSEFRWFGNFAYSISHHCSIFRTSFLLNTAKLALFAGIKNPEHETFISDFLMGKIKSKQKELFKNVKIAVWSNQPQVSYAHASYVGRLTQEGRDLLQRFNIEFYYDETLEGEIFPPDRSYDHVGTTDS